MTELRCQKCDWKWDSRTENPKKCPSCQSIYWHSDEDNDALSLQHLNEAVETKRAEHLELINLVKEAKETISEAQKTTEGMVEDARVQATKILEDAETKATAESKALLLSANATLRSEIAELEQKRNALSQEILIIRNDADAYAAKTRKEADELRASLTQKLAIVQQIKALLAPYDFDHYAYSWTDSIAFSDSPLKAVKKVKKLSEQL